MKRSILLIVFLFVCTSCAPKKELSWAAIGDSITYLDGHPEEANNRTTLGYMARVCEELPNIHYINYGHNGWTTARMAAAIEGLNVMKADIYTVYLGTNDWWGSNTLGTLDDYKNSTGNKTMYGAYRTVINKIRSQNSEAKIILITPMQRGDFVYVKNFKNNAYGSYKEKNGHQLSEFADAVKNIAQLENFELVDLYYKSGITPANVVKYKRLKDPKTGQYKNFTYPEYTTVPFDPVADEYPYPIDAIDMTYDGLHPSDKGLSVIAKMLVGVMKKY
ncbi:SGNH/GDSL hydrolase family protein [Mucilaginibacter mali]|uniref:SGNH/GDSL hydrolase family protein n=1 Tax=Mucilaginibacter mali TaxID=2740462 RepID=A0A7D4PTA0_9SPHI|nr:SGNH/GDSL hydrolase family protein [Mucilaginibacter mali]QKJ29768.1 SGNH/GDSL hydrolase family protein [Mucilaginibacter mali]